MKNGDYLSRYCSQVGNTCQERDSALDGVKISTASEWQKSHCGLMVQNIPECCFLGLNRDLPSRKLLTRANLPGNHL